ncbi:glycosyltransferase family 2 protein [Novipirellula aureliae]|nr:glycosyltransferase family 2 protein [Novipirellula aureliae]
MSTLLAIMGLLLSAIPAATFLRNLPLFLFQPCKANHAGNVKVSVLIPARNEEESITECVESVLKSRNVEIEVVVLDDHSADATADRVAEIAASDSRVRCVNGKPLPENWNGKQYACYQLAAEAGFHWLLFLDADVRLSDTAVSNLVQRMQRTNVALLSSFPHQETGTILEKLLIPLMHYVLLGFLPFARMRMSKSPAYAAGCGQLFLTKKGDYKSAGTHEAIRSSRHDGLKLPRIYRKANLATDVIDGSDLARCRMYRSGGEVIRGLLKNATEGIASPVLIVPFSMLFIGANVVPIVALVLAIIAKSTLGIVVATAAVFVSLLPRVMAARSLKQPWIGVVLHSLSIVIFIAIQWIALAQQLIGRRTAWRGRVS